VGPKGWSGLKGGLWAPGRAYRPNKAGLCAHEGSRKSMSVWPCRDSLLQAMAPVTTALAGVTSGEPEAKGEMERSCLGKAWEEHSAGETWQLKCRESVSLLAHQRTGSMPFPWLSPGQQHLCCASKHWSGTPKVWLLNFSSTNECLDDVERLLYL
jgi:hypothetical protein